MKFQVGDKVKFLNDVGGGIITKIISPTMVNVAIEEGFEYPVSTAEIIPAIQNEQGSKAFNQNFIINNPIQNIDIETNNNEFERETALQKFTSLHVTKNGIYIAYVPHDQVWLLKDNIDVYIVNKSPHDILFSLYLKNGIEFIGTDYGSVSSNSKYHLTTISREEINQWNEGLIQILFHCEKTKSPLAPLNTSFHIKSSRFVSKDSFTPSSIMQEKSILYLLGEISEENITPISIEEIKKIDFLPEMNTATPIKRNSILDHYLKNNDTAEIDLHIESIIENSTLYNENPDNLDPIQILQIQLSHFERCLEEAIRLKLRSIIFIHGVGIGKLKGELKKILNKYHDVHYMDASMQKYGTGAIEVWIK